ncbi:outer membrane beta-barrel protein [Metallibacterium scheffleri]|uniref:Outer membrane protein beta-barrel domain-containing protein n=1 Tax=Metallibacterium scheffleri TaxID=993689 RepID=A0A4S3KT26_9GAMM|nr:outer membrane beta-barrel protein [Metallibacterium scheffleri]THD11374.1 hypothetical protein B1806_04460 [Metallibacterium scheffleri]
MKNRTLTIVAAGLLALAGTASAQTPQTSFQGWYNGAKTGYSQTSGDAVNSTGSWTLGYELGYNWQSQGGFVFGLDGYYDYNAATDHDVSGTTGRLSIGSQAYGMDTKYGWASGPVLYYAKVGYGGLSGMGDASGSGSGFHGGLGIEYKFTPKWSVTGEWLYEAGNTGPANASLTNNNFTVGMNYYF